MSAVIPLPVAIGFSSLCLVGILFLMLLVSVVGRHKPVGEDGCLAFVFSTLLAIAALATLALAL